MRSLLLAEHLGLAQDSIGAVEDDYAQRLRHVRAVRQGHHRTQVHQFPDRELLDAADPLAGERPGPRAVDQFLEALRQPGRWFAQGVLQLIAGLYQRGQLVGVRGGRQGRNCRPQLGRGVIRVLRLPKADRQIPQASPPRRQ